jgi:Xaa-Pro aminopeptidase
MDYDQRRVALLRDLDDLSFLAINLEGSDAVTLFYLTGFTGEGALLLSHEEVLLLTDSRYTEQAKREAPRLPLYAVKQKYLSEIAEVINARAIKRLAFASKRLSHYVVTKLAELNGVKLVAREDPVAELRRVKTQQEIAKIRQAAHLTECAFEELLNQVKIGMNERELALKLEWLMREKGAEKPAFELIVASGENSALPHYHPYPGERQLQVGDLLLFDIGVRLDGYNSDMTRVVAIGEAPSWAREIYDLVLQASRAGLAAVKPGASGVEVDAAARNVIAHAGHKDHFGHGLGHGVGLEVHEGPSLSPMSEDILETGMVVTVEPGVYISGFGGVRIEELVVVTEEGCQVLTSFPCDRLIEVG